MTRIVVDTNIIISSIFWRGHPYEVVIGGLLRGYQLVTSAVILDETVDKLRNKFHFPEEGIQQLVDILLTHSHLIEPASKFDVVRDKNDNKIIECAFDGKADYIVTGDLDLLSLKEFRGIKIITAKEFLDEISKT
ncbi:MAG: putative toxin-antitoxin system toxin component, PIN family [Candidatus Aenigmarchaeota archaeon]|nr:putative toxin-antitoxin system toxin component, PIN family [Candidatus Aenigmarchaeota archaeon]